MRRPLATLAALLFLLLAGLVAAPAARAADAAREPPAAAAGEWQDADLQPMGARGEGYTSRALVTAAYSFLWAAFVVFLLLVWVRGRGLEHELDDLRRRIAAGKAGPTGIQKG